MEGLMGSLDYYCLLLSLRYYCLFLLTHLATSVAAKRDLGQIKDDCCALSCGKGAKVLFLCDPTSQGDGLTRRGCILQIKASVAGVTGSTFGFYAHGSSSGSEVWWGDGASVRKRGKSIFPNSLANLLRKAFKQVHQGIEIKVQKEVEKQVEFKMLREVRKQSKDLDFRRVDFSLVRERVGRNPWGASHSS